MDTDAASETAAAATEEPVAAAEPEAAPEATAEATTEATTETTSDAPAAAAAAPEAVQVSAAPGAPVLPRGEVLLTAAVAASKVGRSRICIAFASPFQ